MKQAAMPGADAMARHSCTVSRCGHWNRPLLHRPVTGHRPCQKNIMKISRVAAMIFHLATFFLVWAQIFLAGEPTVSAENSPGNVTTVRLTLCEAVLTALDNNPDIRALDARYMAAVNIAPQAGSLPDPVLSFNALNLPTDTFSLDQEPMTQMQVKLTQTIPFPGKLSMKETAAGREAEALKFQVDELKLKVVSRVETLWWDVFYLEKALEIVRQNRILIQEIIDTARAKYEVGRGMQQDVLLAQVELSELLNAEVDLQGRIAGGMARLARLAGRDEMISRRIAVDTSVTMEDIGPEREIFRTALAKRPALKAAGKKIGAAQARLKLSQKGYFPDFTLGAAYGFRQDSPQGMDRPNFASFMISMNIPIWAGRKQSREIARRDRELQGQKELYRSSKQQVFQEIASALADLRSLRKQAFFYRDAVIPQARLTFSSMLSAYQVNRVDFLNVIRARLAILGYEKRYWRAITDAKKAEARLRAAEGSLPIACKKVAVSAIHGVKEPGTAGTGTPRHPLSSPCTPPQSDTAQSGDVTR